MPQSLRSSGTNWELGSSPWSQVTWDDLETWAGVRSLQRGKTYANTGRVGDLTIDADHSLLATVRGGQRYTVLVPAPKSGKLAAASCTCPVGYRCKHAVAAIVKYLEALANGTPVPASKGDDRRLKTIRKLQADDEEDEDGNAAWDDEYAEAADRADEEEEYDEESDDARQDYEPRGWSRRSPRRAASSAKRLDVPGSLQAIVESKNHAELVALVLEQASAYPELAKRLQDESLLSSGDAAALIDAARREIRSLTSEQSYWRHWDHEGHLPDFAPLREKFERLLELGLASHLLELGVELLSRGLRQVEESDDEGHVALEIQQCLDLVFQAVPLSGLSAADQLLFAIYALLAVDYDLCAGALVVLDRDWKRSDWSAVADVLCERLFRPSKTAGPAQTDYRRRQLAGFAVQALESSARTSEIASIVEREAREHGDYDRVINWYFAHGNTEAAESWLREALAHTDPNLAGLIGKWRDKLRELAAGRNDWKQVAAHAAEVFFEQPSAANFAELMQAAQKAGCGDVVRAGAVLFLETGQSPALNATQPATRKAIPRSPAESSWPLVAPDYFLLRPPADPKGKPRQPLRRANEPRPDVLLQIAMAEKRPDDVLALYDRHFSKNDKSPSRSPYYYDAGWTPKVAAFVARSHPERAAALYESLILATAEQTGEQFYRQVIEYLKAIRSIAKALDQPARFDQLVARILHEQRRKRKLVEMLSRLYDRPIVEQKRQGGAPVWRAASS